LTRYRPNGGTTAAILSAALATPGSGVNKACAVATTVGTCINSLTSSSSITLAGGATVAVNAGDVLYVSPATADGVQTWYTITIIYTVD
jgi:streptogramin lyase